MDKYYANREIIIKHNDGNYVNGDAPPPSYSPLKRACGYCGDDQEDNEAPACNNCMNDEYIKKWINGD